MKTSRILVKCSGHVCLFLLLLLAARAVGCDLPTGNNPPTPPPFSLSPPVPSGNAISDAHGVAVIQTAFGYNVSPMHSGTVTAIDQLGQGCVTMDNGSGWVSEICGLANVSSALRVGQSVMVPYLGQSNPQLTLILGYNGQPEDPLLYMSPNPYGIPPPPIGAGGNPGVSGAGTAGLESAPVWLWANAASTPRTDNHAIALYPNVSYSLTQFFPSVFQNASVVLVTPNNVTTESNAVLAAGAEYHAGGIIVATATAYLTTGSAYVHDYAVCNRFKGGFLQQVQQFDVSSAINAPSPTFVFGNSTSITAQNLPAYQEFAATTVAYDLGDHFLLSSRWITDEYTASPTTPILTFQVWAASPATTASLLQSMLALLSSQKTVAFEATPLQNPNIFAIAASYDDHQITLETRNTAGAPVSVSANIVGYPNMLSASAKQSWTTVTVPPGDNQITLNSPDLLNAVVYLNTDSFTDKVYVSDGDWEVWSGGSTAPTVAMSAQPCTQAIANNLQPVRSLPGCLTLTGTVPNGAWAGLARVVTTPTRSFLNLAATGADALTFVTSGTPGPFQVHLQLTTTDANGNGSYGAVFQNSGTPTTVTIPLSSFTLSGSSQPLDPAELTNLTSVSWTTTGVPITSLNLAIENAAFTRAAPILTPTVTVTLSASSITTAQPVNVTVTVGGGGSHPTPTGTVTLTSGSYSSAAATLTAGATMINLPAGSLSTGTDSLTAAYSGDSNYGAATGAASIRVNPPPSFTLSASPAMVSIAQGASGTSTTISVVGTNGFSGTVDLTCKVTTSMSNVNNMPICSLNPTSVTINGTTAQTSTLKVSKTAATSATNQLRKALWPSAGGATLALLVFFAAPRRRSWSEMFGVIALLVSLGTVGCGGGGSQGGGGGGNAGTTPESYTIMVTGTSGTVSAAVGTITLTVQ